MISLHKFMRTLKRLGLPFDDASWNSNIMVDAFMEKVSEGKYETK